MTLAPITFDVAAIQQAPPPTSPTIIGIVGSGTGANSANNVPVAVNTLVDAQSVFGVGTIADACAEIYRQASLWVVGIRFDASAGIGPPTRAGRLEAAINELERAATATGRKPTVILAPKEGYVSPTDGSAVPAVPILISVAENLRAIAIADASPGTVAIATQWNTANGGGRLLSIAQSMGTSGKPLVDIAGMTGGSESCDWIARLLVSSRVFGSQ